MGEGMSMSDDAGKLRQQRVLFDQVDHAISETNREVIHGLIPKLDKAVFLKMAKGVAQLRVKYIAAGIQLAQTDSLKEPQLQQLKTLREQFEEARAAFDAVKRAVSRGYIDIAE
jgi:hypothetical protein